VSEPKPKDQATSAADQAAPASVERYLVFDEIGVGGMASVHLGMLTGAVGFRRIVALKQLHARFIHDPDFVEQFINEARLAAHIHHANVVQTLDVVWTGKQLLLVMEYVDGDTLNRVLRSAVERREQVPIEVACSMIAGVLHGLHAAHEVRDEEGARLDIVHRDVSPQNILIGRDGIARVLDFGVAKALAQSPNTQSGLVKGKFGYMAPEQIMRGHVDRRTDVFAAGVVLWETLTCRRLFQASKNIEQAMSRVIAGEIPPPSAYRPEIPPQLDAIVMRAMARDAEQRFQTAEALAVAMEDDVGVASPHIVKTWFGPLASPELAQRAELIRNINKRYGAPGRSTPYPSALTEEVRAAIAASPEFEELRRKAALGELSGAPVSGVSSAASNASMPSRSSSPASPYRVANNTSQSQTLASRMTPNGATSGTDRRPTTQPRRLRPVLMLDDQFVPTTGGHIADIPESARTAYPRWRRWARNVGGAVLASTLFMATWITAIGWNDQPPTSEHLRARREAARIQNVTSPRDAPAAEQALDASGRSERRGVSSRREARSPAPPADNRPASTRPKGAERAHSPAPAGNLELRLTR
jgi:serine/threonine-protein kinase